MNFQALKNRMRNKGSNYFIILLYIFFKFNRLIVHLYHINPPSKILHKSKII